MQNHFRRPFVAHYRLLLISPSKMVCSVEVSCNHLSTIFAAPPDSDLTHHLVADHKRVDPSYRYYLKFKSRRNWELSQRFWRVLCCSPIHCIRVRGKSLVYTYYKSQKSERVKQWKGFFSSFLPNLHQTQIHHLTDFAPKNLTNFKQE